MGAAWGVGKLKDGVEDYHIPSIPTPSTKERVVLTRTLEGDRRSGGSRVSEKQRVFRRCQLVLGLGLGESAREAESLREWAAVWR